MCFVFSFPFLAIPCNDRLWSCSRNVGMDLYIISPFLNNGNGIVYSHSRSRTLESHSLSPPLQPSLNLCSGVEVPKLLGIDEIHIWEWVEAINFVRSSTGSLVTHITIAPGKTQIQIFLPPCTDCTYFNVNISRRLTSHSVSLHLFTTVPGKTLRLQDISPSQILPKSCPTQNLPKYERLQQQIYSWTINYAYPSLCPQLTPSACRLHALTPRHLVPPT